MRDDCQSLLVAAHVACFHFARRADSDGCRLLAPWAEERADTGSHTGGPPSLTERGDGPAVYVEHMSGKRGNPAHVAMKISGHKTPSMFKRYDIISEDDLREAMDRTQTFIAESKAERQQPTPIRQAAGGKN